MSELFNDLIVVNNHHYQNCGEFRKIVDNIFNHEYQDFSDLPYIPASLFKEIELKSISPDDVYKVMYSSGTSGLQSRIFLDKNTAKAQSRALSQTFTAVFGRKRLPFLIIDSSEVAGGTTARTAAVNGFSMFSKAREYALKNDYSIDYEVIANFLDKYQQEPFLVFGFTAVIQELFLDPLFRTNTKVPFNNAMILHGGGWKKLTNRNISSSEFEQSLKELTNCRSIHNYYGMIEQTGSIYLACSQGRLHCPDTGWVIARDVHTLKPLASGEPGILQVFSLVQRSFPGHSILTEDFGRVYYEKDCSCGNDSPYIEIDGRLDSTPVRGCSDAVTI